jgi:hypothetical protein
MNRHRWPNAEAEDGSRHQEGDDTQADEDVLPDDSTGMAAKTDCEWQVRQIVGHQRHVGCLQRNVRPRRAHRDADRGACHRRRIVHAVAHHRDLVFAGELLDRGNLVFGHEVAPRFVDPDFVGDRFGDFLVIAGDHYHPRHAHLVQPTQRGLGSFARRVHQADRAQVAVPLADHHCRAAVLAQLRDCVLRALPQRRNALTSEHLGLADPHRLAIHARGDAPTGQALEVAGSRHGTIVQTFAAVLDDRLGQGMVAQRFDGDSQRQQLAFIGAIDGHDISDARTTFGQRARLVESDRFERPEVFERCTALHEHAARAARATPDRTALGVAIASAHGLAATSTAIAR